MIGYVNKTRHHPLDTKRGRFSLLYLVKCEANEFDWVALYKICSFFLTRLVPSFSLFLSFF